MNHKGEEGKENYRLLIRNAEAEDALAVARVHVRSWQVAYRGLLPAAYLDSLKAEDRAKKYDLANRDPQKPRTIVATEGREIIGFASLSPSKEPDLPNWVELSALYVDPDSWNRGVGRALIEAARGLMIKAGFESSFLWLLSGNARAARFYEVDGWRKDGVNRNVTAWGIKVDEMRYVRSLKEG